MADHGTLNAECPELLLEWDYEKNGPLLPENVRKYSGKQVWWKCKYGHSWRAPVSRRSGGSGCPYCSGNLVWEGFNDISSIYPHIAAEWNHEQNGDLHPEQVSGGCNKAVWWKCKHGHAWKAVIASRIAGSGCPYCAGKLPVMGENDLLTTHPKVVAEWDYDKNGELRPEQVTSFSSRFAWWRCSQGHSWRTQIHVRTKGHQCPYCVGIKPIEGENDLKTLKPDLAKEWDYEMNNGMYPEHFKCSSNKSVWWKCEEGHSWKTAITHRNAGRNCPYCSGRKVWVGFNDIDTTHPRLIAEWDYEKNKTIQPDKVSAGSNKSIWWKCNLGHVWKAQVCERTSGKNCPYCCGRRALKGYNDLSTSYPDVAAQWDYTKNNNLTPKQVTAGSNKIVWWQCHLGHSWKAAIYSRTGENGSDCPYCKGHTVLEYFNDLKTINPQMAGEWDYDKNYPLRPENVAESSNKKVWWICKRGHSYAATMANRYHGKDCPYCAGKYPIAGETDLLTVYPEWLVEWDCERNGSKRPEHYTSGSNAKVWWKCKKGHSWRARIIERNSGNGCPYCSGRVQMRTRFVR